MLFYLWVLTGKFLTSEVLSSRRLGVLLFEVRSFLDSLDGIVARTRSKQRAMIADHTQWGYWMDGFCDLLGTIFFMVAVLLICQRSMPRKGPSIYYVITFWDEAIGCFNLYNDVPKVKKFIFRPAVPLIWFPRFPK